MTYAIISDIHANEIALAAVIEDARACGAGKVICLGDVVGYGPEPEKTVNAIRRIAAVSLAGNHDDAVAGRLDPSDFIDLAADAVSRHRDALSPENLNWLKSRPYLFRAKTFACSHSDFTSPKSFLYVSDEFEAAANFAATREQLMFVGHSHVPGIFLVGSSGKVYSLAPTDFTVEDGKRYIVNPGSVGYPRTDGNTCESTYVLYDDVERTVTFRRLPFTVRSVMQTGRNQKRIKKRIIAGIAVAAAVAAGTAAWLLAPEERVETVTEVVTNRVQTVKIVTNRVTNVSAIGHIDRTAKCDIPMGTRKALVLVRLGKDSPAAHLQLAFRDGSGKITGDERWTVKRSKKAKVPVPVGSASATLTGGRTDGDKPAAFDVFSVEPVK